MGSCEEKNTYNGNYFPGSDKLLAVKISISHLVSPVTERH